MTEKEVYELKCLESHATEGPWLVSDDAKKWVTSNAESDWVGNRDNDAAFVAAIRNKAALLLNDWLYMRQTLLEIEKRNRPPFCTDSLGTEFIVRKALDKIGRD